MSSTIPLRLALLLLVLSLAALPAAAAIPVTGQVTDEDGEPLAGATVELLPVESPAARAAADLEGVFRAQAVDRTESGDDGRFRLSAPAEGFWTVVASAPGRLAVVSDVGPLRRQEELTPFILPQESLVTVRVVDGEGRPVAGATVAAEREGLSGSRRWRPRLELVARRRALTGEDGVARLQRRDDEVLVVRATAPGFAPAAAEGVEGADVTLELAAGRAVEVEVRGPDGAPVAGAALLAGDLPLGTSDDAGRLTVHAPSGDELTLVALASGERRGRLELAPPEEGAESAEQASSETAADATEAPPAAVLRLSPPVAVSGRTLDADRQPVPGAWVWEGGRRHLAVRSDGRGGFELPRPAPEEDERSALRADAAGFLPAAERLRPAQAAGEEAATLLLHPAAAATGRVVDDAGEPVAGVVIAAMPAGGSRFRFRRQTGVPRVRSDGDGTFRFHRLDPGTSHRLAVRHPGYAPASVELAGLEPSATRSGLEIVLRAGLTAVGTVLDLDEQPVAGAEVTLTAVPEGGADMMTLFRRLRDAEPQRGTTDGTGVYTIPDMAPGRYDLAVDAAGFAPLEVPGVELVAGRAEADLGTVFLEPGVSLMGTAVDAEGRPVEGARVRATAGGGPISRRRPDRDREPVRTAADGTFRIEGLARERPVDLSVEHDRFTDRTVPGVRVPLEEPLVITLQPSARISGRVVDGDGEPVEDASVSSRTAQILGGSRNAFARTTTGADGGFILDDVAPGEVLVQASARGYVTAERAGIQLASGGVAEDVRLVLEPGAEVTGRVVDAAGGPLADARVRIVVGERAVAYRIGAATDAEGVYRMDGVPLGQHSFSAEHEGHLRRVLDLEVGRGENRLDFRLDAASFVAGRVTDAGGAPVAGARVFLASATGPSWHAGKDSISGEDGAYRIEGVAPGRYRVRASREGYAAAVTEEAIRVAGTPVRGVDLVLGRGGSIVGRLIGVELADLADVTIGAAPHDQGAAPGAAVSGTVDYEGAFRIEGVGAGTWRVFALVEGRLATTDEPVTMGPEGGEVYVEIDVGGGFTLSGSVLLGGEPMQSAAVMMQGEDGGFTAGFGSTDHRGRFEISGLDPGGYELLVVDQRGGGASHQQELEITGDREITIEITTGEVSGVVTDAISGRPLEGVAVELEPVDDTTGLPVRGRRPSRTGADGRFRLTTVPPGEYRLRAAEPGYADGVTGVSVRGGSPVTDVELRLEPTRGLTLEVRSTLGQPPSRVAVAAFDPAATTGATPVVTGPPGSELGGAAGGGAAGGAAAGAADAATPSPPTAALQTRETLGEGGRLRLDRLPAGRWRLLVAAEGLTTTALEVTAPGPAVPVVMTPESVLRVRVPDLADAIAAGEVWLTGADGRPHVGLDWGGRPRVTWDLSFGQTRIGGLPAGTWTVNAVSGTGDTWSATVAVPAGGEVRAILD